MSLSPVLLLGLRRRAAVGTTLLALAAGLGGVAPDATAAPASPVAPAAPTAAPVTAATTAPGVPARYRNQTIRWSPCFDTLPEGAPAGAERLECGTYTVPRDWDRPGAKVDLTIAVSRLNPATGRAPVTILTNPGGPGGPGLTLPLIYLEAERTRLTGSREIVGIDPRGTGASTNVTCRGGATIGTDRDFRDRSAGNVALLLRSAELGADFCQAERLSRYITTEQTVRDLDLLRALLGRTKVDWIGYSGGTWLGAAYATYFPKRTGRFVLDANTDFTARWQRTFGLQPLGFERRFRSDFLPWVAAQPSTYRLGSTPAQVRRSYEDLRADLAAEPLELLPGLALDQNLLDSLVISALYDKSTFPDLAALLSELVAFVDGERTAGDLDGVGQDTLALQRTLQQRRPGLLPAATSDAQEATFLDITCNDTPWRGGAAALVRTSAEQGRRYPLVGYRTILQPCAFWDRDGLETLAPRTGKGVPPVLMLQNDRDPATPIEGARHARRTFAGARMVTVVNEGNHTIYPGNPCVDAKVEAFLLDGAKAADATCLGLGLPPVVPEPTGRAATRRVDAGPSPLERNQQLADLVQLR